MLIAYADESGHAADPKVEHVGLAGLIASEQKWNILREQWSAVLGNYGIAAFHMREFAHRRGSFADWVEKSRRDLLGQLLSLIEELEPKIIGSVISLRAWRALDAADQKLFLNPYYACIQEFAYLAAVQAASVGQDSVRVVFSQNSEFAGRAKSLFAALRRSESMPASVDAYEYGDMRTEPGLQAADLVAYEIVLAHDQAAKGVTKLRYPFERIRQSTIFVRYIDELWLGKQVSGARAAEI